MPMERIGLHTRLKAGMEAEYDAVHATIPAGARCCFEGGGCAPVEHLALGPGTVSLVEVEDYARVRRKLADDPVNVAWQNRMAELLDVEDEYSGNNDEISKVWSLI